MMRLMSVPDTSWESVVAKTRVHPEMRYMQYLAVLQLLILLALANGSPVVAKRIFGNNCAWPLDGNIRFVDGQPLFGASKTVRGILVSIFITSACAPLLGLTLKIGLVVATTAMAGDLLSSFLKRRLGLRPSSQAVASTKFQNRCFRCSLAAKRSR